MPATRSSSIPPRPQPFPTPSPPQRRHRVDHDSDAISFTSSDVETSKIQPTKKRQDKVQSRTRAKKPTVVPPAADIIEISSDDESPHLISQPSVIADYRRQISKLREESVKHKKNFERASRELKTVREENQRLQALRQPADGKVILDAAKLSDHLDCEICTCRMWTPYILPDCGHLFCQSCLQDWFGTTQAQFLATHPNNPNMNHAFMELLRTLAQNPHLATLPYVQAMITNQMPPHPVYTCPTCREQVRTRPTEAFALKALVSTIAAATGEPVPKQNAPPVNRKGKASGNTPGPWDGFFPPKKT